MMFAYILIKCETGFENVIIQKLLKISEVREAHAVFGEYDIFVKIESDTKDELEDILHLIRKIPNVDSTNSLFPVLSQGGR